MGELCVTGASVPEETTVLELPEVVKGYLVGVEEG